jgi:hypothetical protein
MAEKNDDAAGELAKKYSRVFVGFHEGTEVLQDLVARFHDRSIHVAGGIEAQRETEKRAAQKEVIGFILRKIGQVSQEDSNAD